MAVPNLPPRSWQQTRVIGDQGAAHADVDGDIEVDRADPADNQQVGDETGHLNVDGVAKAPTARRTLLGVSAKSGTTQHADAKLATQREAEATEAGRGHAA